MRYNDIRQDIYQSCTEEPFHIEVIPSPRDHARSNVLEAALWQQYLVVAGFMLFGIAKMWANRSQLGLVRTNVAAWFAIEMSKLPGAEFSEHMMFRPQAASIPTGPVHSF